MKLNIEPFEALKKRKEKYASSLTALSIDKLNEVKVKEKADVATK